MEPKIYIQYNPNWNNYTITVTPPQYCVAVSAEQNAIQDKKELASKIASQIAEKIYNDVFNTLSGAISDHEHLGSDKFYAPTFPTEHLDTPITSGYNEEPHEILAKLYGNSYKHDLLPDSSISNLNKLKESKPKEIIQEYKAKWHYAPAVKQPSEFSVKKSYSDYTSGQKIVSDLAKVFPAVTKNAQHPVNGETTTISAIIQHLNDHCRWTREEIADWLTTLSVDIRMVDEHGNPIKKEK